MISRASAVTLCTVTAPSLIGRITAMVLLLALAAASPAVALCAGWAGSAAERMACCDHDASGCTSVSSDSCCADGEARQNVETTAALITVREPAVSAPVVVVAPRKTARAADPRSLAEPPAPHLLHSVFRI